MLKETRYKIELPRDNCGRHFVLAVNQLGAICSIDKIYMATAFTEAEMRDNVQRAQLRDYFLIRVEAV